MRPERADMRLRRADLVQMGLVNWGAFLATDQIAFNDIISMAHGIYYMRTFNVFPLSADSSSMHTSKLGKEYPIHMSLN